MKAGKMNGKPSSHRVLVVDDDSRMRLFLERAFIKHGFEALTARSAEEALEILEREKVPVIFLDLVLPGMNGIELCKTIRRNNSWSKIFAISGYSELLDDQSRIYGAGFDGVFSKPLDLPRVFDAAKAAADSVEMPND